MAVLTKIPDGLPVSGWSDNMCVLIPPEKRVRQVRLSLVQFQSARMETVLELWEEGDGRPLLFFSLVFCLPFTNAGTTADGGHNERTVHYSLTRF